MTGKIEGGTGFGPLSGIRNTKEVKAPRSKEGSASVDRVDFSSVLQDVSKARETSSPAQAARAEKVAALKQQIASGNYQPDLEKVAESILRFITQG